MNLEERMYDGELARQILDNKVFGAVLDDMEQELLQTWKFSTSEAERESLHKYLKTLEKFRERIQATLDKGKLAKLEIEHKRSLREKLGMPQLFGQH